MAKWFKGTVRPTAEFTDTDEPNETHKYTYKAVQGNLFGANGPTIGDIAQNPFGNCYFVAGLGSMFGQQRPPEGTTENNPFRGTTTSQVIKDVIVENKDSNGSTSYTIRFYNSEGKAEYVTVDNQLITEDNQIAGSARNRKLDDPNNVLWVPILERAYAQWLGSYDKMGNGGYPSEVQQQIKGGNSITYELKKPETTFQNLRDGFQEGKSVTAGNLYKGNKVFYSGHAYTITDAYSDANGVQHVVVYNPHGQNAGANAGVSGPYEDLRVTPLREDGFVDVTFEEFRETMTYFWVL